MTLAASGAMSIGGSTATRSINLELGRSATATSSMGESTLRTLAGVPSGAISMSNFYGKSFSLVALPGNPYSLYGVATQPNTASATLRFRGTGTVARIVTVGIGNSTSTTEYGTWLLSGAASDYTLVLTSGNVGLLNAYSGSASALNTPYALTSGIDISLSNSSGDTIVSGVYGFDIRTTSGSVLVSGTVTLSAEHFTSGGGGGTA